MGGCVASKQKSNPYERIADYQKESDAYLKNLSVEPRYLMTENYRDGYISPDLFYNWIHAGFCGPYISNPYYMILIDFRSLEDYMQSHISTAIHHSHFQWDSSHIVQDLEKYSLVVFYDFDGTSTANVKSPETKAIRSLKDKKIEIFCIVGGLRSVCAKFPHLIEQSRFLNHAVTSPPPSRKSREERGRLSWMPCLVYEDRVFLGSYEQADDEKVLRSLDITHVLSIGRSPETNIPEVKYNGLDGEEDLYRAIVDGSKYIHAIVRKGGRILIHGVDGLNRSAAVIIGYLMLSTPCLLEEAYFYLQTIRPLLKVDSEALMCLLKWEKQIFGQNITDLGQIWY